MMFCCCKRFIYSDPLISKHSGRLIAVACLCFLLGSFVYLGKIFFPKLLEMFQAKEPEERKGLYKMVYFLSFSLHHKDLRLNIAMCLPSMNSPSLPISRYCQVSDLVCLSPSPH